MPHHRITFRRRATNPGRLSSWARDSQSRTRLAARHRIRSPNGQDRAGHYELCQKVLAATSSIQDRPAHDRRPRTGHDLLPSDLQRTQASRTDWALGIEARSRALVWEGEEGSPTGSRVSCRPLVRPPASAPSTPLLSSPLRKRRSRGWPRGGLTNKGDRRTPVQRLHDRVPPS
jgi:hypothetical protein